MTVGGLQSVPFTLDTFRWQQNRTLAPFKLNWVADEATDWERELKSNGYSQQKDMNFGCVNVNLYHNRDAKRYLIKIGIEETAVIVADSFLDVLEVLNHFQPIFSLLVQHDLKTQLVDLNETFKAGAVKRLTDSVLDVDSLQSSMDSMSSSVESRH